MTVRQPWLGAIVVCLGGGPSLTQADVDACRGRARVLAINDAYRLALWADALYGCDAEWWAWHQGVPSFAGRKFALEPPAAIWPGVEIVPATGTDGLETEIFGVRTGRNSGYQAINLAVQLGARRVVLLGYDMQPGPGGASHWFGEHPSGIAPPFDLFLPTFPTLIEPLRARGIDVLNCSRRTALGAFPRVPLEEALAA